MNGKLSVVPTPIGNLEDITLRAIRVLKEVDLILTEDTRTSSKLLKHLGITTPMKSFHSFNEHYSLEHVIGMLNSGKRLAQISDAGTPGISDPGFMLVRACVEEGIVVEVLPGATAFVPALVGSGLPCDSFWFYGFLPHKKGRQTAMKQLAAWPLTFVLYESPHRLIRTLRELSLACGENRRACVVREISKIYESFERGTLAELATQYEAKGKALGEIVIVVGPADKPPKNLKKVKVLE